MTTEEVQKEWQEKMQWFLKLVGHKATTPQELLAKKIALLNVLEEMRVLVSEGVLDVETE